MRPTIIVEVPKPPIRNTYVAAMRQRGGSGPHHDKRAKRRDRQERRERREYTDK